MVDSDFDIDETDEVKSDQEDADGKRPRRTQKGVVTKAYKVGRIIVRRAVMVYRAVVRCDVSE